MESQQRIEQIVVIALLVVLAVGCLTVLRPFLSALLWALILSYSSWPLYAWLVRRLGGRRTLAASVMTLLVAAISILPLAAVGAGLADSVAKVAPAGPRSSNRTWTPAWTGCSASGCAWARPFCRSA